MIEFLFELSTLDKIILIGALFGINILISFFQRIFISRYYKKINSREQAMEKIRGINRYIVIPIRIITGIILYFLLFDVCYEYKYWLLMICILMYVSIMLMCIICNSIVYGVLKEIRDVEESTSERIITTIKVITFQSIVVFILGISIQFIFDLNTDSQLMRLGMILIITIVYIIVINLIFPKIIIWIVKCYEMEDCELKRELITMGKDVCYTDVNIYIWKTKKQKIANAMITGIGEKYIYISDYLLNNESIEEIKAVIAHELGHVKYNHIRKRILYLCFSIIVIISTPFLFETFYWWADSLIVFIVILCEFIILFLIINRSISRRQEKQADEFVLERGCNIEVYKSALLKLAQLNDTKVKKNKIDEKFETHPSIENRIKHLENK